MYIGCLFIWISDCRISKSGESLLNSLEDIFIEYGTDKYPNGYAELYEKVFEPIRESVTSLLEIGVWRGQSLKAWEEYFQNAAIYGLDRDYQWTDKFLGERIFTYHIDVSWSGDLDAWAQEKEFDIIIDDGSHINRDVILAFEVLWPRLKDGGYYIIEDTPVMYGNYPQYIDETYPLVPNYFKEYSSSEGNRIWMLK